MKKPCVLATLLAAVLAATAVPTRADQFDPSADWRLSPNERLAAAMLREPAHDELRTRHTATVRLDADAAYADDYSQFAAAARSYHARPQADGSTVAGYSLMSLTADAPAATVYAPATALSPQPAAVSTAANGAVYSCGYNANGAVGDGTTTNRSSFVAVTGLPSGNVTAVAAGTAHTVYVVNGAVYTVGNNYYGQVGNGTNSASGQGYNTPQATLVLTGGVTNVSAGYTHSLAVTNTGALYGWGSEYYAQLGNGVPGGSTTTQNTPVAIPNFSSGVTGIAAGYYNSYVIQNGALYSTGAGQYGQLGNGQTLANGTYQNSFATTTLTAGVTQVATGFTHALAVVNGGVYTWGNNTYGQLGNGTNTNNPTPTPILSLSTGVTQVAGGYVFSMALQNGNVFVWGSNQTGQLGNGTNSTSNTAATTPVQVDPTDLKNIVAIAAGEYSCYALAADGSLWVWGRNNYGQLGDGTTTERDTPEHLLPPTGYVYTAIDADGSGGASFGHFDTILAPVVVVPEPSTWAALAAGAGLLGIITYRRHRAVA